MVMPRSRSISMESSTCSTISRSASAPVAWISRSASVDLPWSIWAMIEKLRMLSMAAFMARGLALASGRSKHVGSIAFFARPSRARRETRLLRRHLLLGEQRLQHDRPVGLRHDGVAGRHRLPVRAVAVERLGYDHQIAAGLAIIERVGIVVGGVTEGVEVAAVGQRGGEP